MIGNIETQFQIRPEEREMGYFAESPEQIEENLDYNRARLLELAPILGLDVNYLKQIFTQQVAVGAAIQSFPLPTAFSDGPKVLRKAYATAVIIADTLTASDIQANPYLYVTLAYDTPPKSGFSAQSYISIPDSKNGAEKIRFMPRNRTYSLPYINITFPRKNLEEMLALMRVRKASFSVLSKKGGYRDLSKREKMQIVTDIEHDLSTALESMRQLSTNAANIPYYNFINSYNLIIGKKVLGIETIITDADLTMSGPMISRGVGDIATFITTLLELEYIQVGKPLLKVFNPVTGKMRQLTLTAYPNVANPIFNYINESDEPAEPISWEELRKMQVFPGKKIYYLFALSGILPFVYGDDNNTPFYPPYLEIVNLFNRLGLKPTMYPFRSPSQDQGQNPLRDATIIDFYAMCNE